MKSTKSTKSTMGSKSTKTKTSSLKKYSAGAVVSEESSFDKGKGKKSTGNKYWNKLKQENQDMVDAYKKQEPKDIKTYKKYERRLVDGYNDLYNRVKKGVTSTFKKGGEVGKSRRK
jgi:hypothetical protein